MIFSNRVVIITLSYCLRRYMQKSGYPPLMTANTNVVCPTFPGPTVGRTPNLLSPTVAKIVMAKILRGKRSEKLVLGVRGAELVWTRNLC
jgi:hypothetical protein